MKLVDRGAILCHFLAVPRGPGFAKLESFCAAASRHDKTSSSELDESLRSMFKWYRNSSICIAYLAPTVRVADLEMDLWFTRGWTLQELLAPKRLKFFGAGCHDIAYCLMGIFHVVLPIAYGEGSERAFFRLFEAII
ncbi:hypothetical protein BDR05DRAFT_977423 [Suillus weaverae]|nr:hypothetical protein BDR05DRAFT_977423 [Suillus weaverae]